MRISDWSSDVCSSDLPVCGARGTGARPARTCTASCRWRSACRAGCGTASRRRFSVRNGSARSRKAGPAARSEEHTSELQSLMRISYAVFCLKKKNIIYILTSYIRQYTEHHLTLKLIHELIPHILSIH